MAGFLGVPEKRTDSLSWNISRLTSIFASSVTADITMSFQNSLKKLDELRSDAISGRQRLVTGLPLEEALSRYLDQLMFLEAAIPPQYLQDIPFTWKNAFSNGTVIVYYTFFTHMSIAFEKICVLFNLAAFLSQKAAGSVESAIDDDSKLREAAQLFQRSAGIFQYIRSVSAVSTVSGVTTDLHFGTLQALECLCLAQAQECFYLKAHQDKKAPSVAARLAQRCFELYEASWKHMKKEHPCSYQWAYVIQFKQHAFQAVAHLHQAEADGAVGLVGNELARLELAKTSFHKAAKHRANISILVLGPHWSELTKRAEQNHKKRHYENECIYKEKITPVDDLPAITAAGLAKATALTFPLSTQENMFRDLPKSFRSSDSAQISEIPLD